MEGLDRTLKALADPNRLRILNILFRQETCVCDLHAILELSQPLLSRHLAYLRNAGLVVDRREGTRVYYSLTLDGELGQAVGAFLEKLFERYETFHADSARLSESLEEFDSLEGRMTCSAAPET